MDLLYIITAPPPQQVLLPDIERRDIELAPLPEAFHIRRGFGVAAVEFGPYTATEVESYLAEGSLSPDDYYRSTTGQWQKLQTSGLIP